MRLAGFLVLLWAFLAVPAAIASEEDPLTVQFGLILSGHYTGPADGIIGPRSREAIASFQQQMGEPVTGSLTPRQSEQLYRIFENAIIELEVFPVLDQTTGVWLYLPGSILYADGPTQRGFRFVSDFASLELETVRVPRRDTAFEELFNRLTSLSGRQVDYSAIGDDWLVVQATEGGTTLYTRFYTNGFEHRGFSISFEQSEQHDLLPIVYFLSEVFFPFSGVPDDAFRVPEDLYADNPQTITRPPSSDSAEPDRYEGEDAYLVGSGTGFHVNSSGTIVTNAHVVDGCGRVEAADGHPLVIEHYDRAMDLALLRGPASRTFLRISDETLILGEEIIALGYPLADILGDGLRVSGGIISGLSGLRGASTQFTFTAPIQPGNSGGPILNSRGEVVGVVVARLNEQSMLESGQPLPQNVNFGIRPEAVSMVLEIAGQEATTGPRKGNDRELTTAQIASLASDAVIQVFCIR